MAFETSELYKEAIDSLSRTTYISGSLVTQSGREIQITNETIDQGSLYITNQCVSSDSFSYGSVFAAEMGITLKTEIDRYSLFGAKIELSFNILLSNNEYETLPLGVFYVNEPNRVGQNISIKAYDKMVDLEDELETSTTGTPYELLSLIGEKFEIDLAQSQNEIDELTNGTQLLSAMQDRISSYRELLSYIACVTCSFAIIDRAGKLKLVPYQTEVSKQVAINLRSSSSFSDFETYYSGITASFIEEGVFNKYASLSEDESGLLYEMGEIPAVQGLAESNQQILDNIFDTLSQVRYTPCDITFTGDPSIELGDMIKCVDRKGNVMLSLVTFYKWSYRGRHQIKSAGSNPKLSSVKEKKSSDLSGLQAQIESKTVAVYSFANASEYTVKGGMPDDVYSMKEVITMSFSPNVDTTAVFLATVTFDLDVDGLVEFRMYIDSVPQDTDVFSQYCQKGKNMVTFTTVIPCSSEAASYKCSIFCRTEAVVSDVRQIKADIITSNNAKNAVISAYDSIVSALNSNSSLPISSLSQISYDTAEPETTVPTLTIKKGFAKASIFGQGLATKAPWDGTITVFDELSSAIMQSDIETTLPFVRAVVNSIETQVPTSEIVSDNVSPAHMLSVMSVTAVNDTLLMNEVVTNYTFDTSKSGAYEYNTQAISTDNNEYSLIGAYTYNSEAEEIDEGSLCNLKVMTSDKSNVESVVIE